MNDFLPKLLVYRYPKLSEKLIAVCDQIYVFCGFERDESQLPGKGTRIGKPSKFRFTVYGHD